MAQNDSGSLPDSVIILFAGICLFMLGFRKLRYLKLIEDTPTSKIRSIAMGRVEICGKAFRADGQEVEAPFSGKKCCYYRWELVRSDKSKNMEPYVSRMGESGEFYVEDETGRVLVDPAGCELKLDMSYDKGLVDEKAISYLRSKGIEIDFKNTGRYSVKEWCISSGHDVYVMGYAENMDFPQGWNYQDSVQDLVIRSRHGLFSYISKSSEKDVVAYHRRIVVLSFVGGIFLILLGLWGLLSYFGFL